MRMSHVYQPVMFRELLSRNGRVVRQDLKIQVFVVLHNRCLFVLAIAGLVNGSCQPLDLGTRAMHPHVPSLSKSLVY
jgi:hypothetical protein